jgi:hypothetical protein
LEAKRRLAAVAIGAALPAAPIVLLTSGSPLLALFACGLLPAAVILAGPIAWRGWGRFGGLILVGPALVTMIVPGFFTIYTVGFALCTSDDGRSYLSTAGAVLVLCAFAVSYLLGSSWAVARPSRALWAWPLVVLAAIAIGLVLLALVEGGPHHCET